MFKLIKMLFTFCLIGGISILGYEIYKNNRYTETGLEDKIPEIRHKISEVKKEAEEKPAVVGEILEKAPNAHKNDNPQQIKSINPANLIKKENIPIKEYPEVAAKAEKIKDVSLNPLDEEDRELTEKVLSKNMEDQNFFEKKKLME